MKSEIVAIAKQMPFVICQIREEFIQFLECEFGTSWQELYLKLVNVIRNLGLEISNFMMELVIWQGKKVVYHPEF